MKKTLLIFLVTLVSILGIEKAKASSNNPWGVQSCYTDASLTNIVPLSYCDSFPSVPVIGVTVTGTTTYTFPVALRIDKDMVTAQIEMMYINCGLVIDYNAINNYWYPRMVDSYGGDFILARHMTNVYISQHSRIGAACVLN